MHMSNADIGERFVDEVINGRDFDVIDEIVADDFVYIDPARGRLVGPAELKRVTKELATAFPDLMWIEDEEISSGDILVSRFTWTGTHVGYFRDLPATGKKVTVNGVAINRITDGMMRETRMVRDDLGFMRQLGYVLERH
jgi:steroid delta-isomerase-like uncharacterized protein